MLNRPLHEGTALEIGSAANFYYLSVRRSISKTDQNSLLKVSLKIAQKSDLYHLGKYRFRNECLFSTAASHVKIKILQSEAAEKLKFSPLKEHTKSAKNVIFTILATLVSLRSAFLNCAPPFKNRIFVTTRHINLKFTFVRLHLSLTMRKMAQKSVFSHASNYCVFVLIVHFNTKNCCTFRAVQGQTRPTRRGEKGAQDVAGARKPAPAVTTTTQPPATPTNLLPANVSLPVSVYRCSVCGCL